ncbi:receptor-type adenylate cyclase, partial [Trypanosoma grayi]|uniref:receptor-type adenylate cyclase n=1 Tax=Trypanosoma grayi TaxID=71804 RepID=UPI0004F42DA9
VNYGASSLSVWTLGRLLKPSVKPLLSPITPQMECPSSPGAVVTAVASFVKRVKILSLYGSQMDKTTEMANALTAGFKASTWVRSFHMGNPVHVEIIENHSPTKDIDKFIDEAMKKHPELIAVLGPMGDRTTLNALPSLGKHHLVALAPFTGSSLVRVWNSSLYFFRVDPSAELLAIIRYIVNHLRVRRVGFMYLQGMSFGDMEYQLAVRSFSQMGYELSGVFTVISSLSGSADNAIFNAEWEKFADTHPQAVIVFGSPVSDTTKFIKKMLTDSRTSEAYLLGPSTVQDILLTAWQAAIRGGVKFVPGQVITTGADPLATNTQFEAMRRFRAVMQEYLTHSGQKEFKDHKRFLNNDNDGELMVAGWIAGEVFSQALSNRNDLKDRETFRRSLFNQRRYVVDDIVIGDFGGECIGKASLQGSICQCNQGGRTVYMKRFVEGYRAEVVKDGLLTYSASQCYVTSFQMLAPLNSVAVAISDMAVATKASENFHTGAAAGLSDGRIETAHEFSIKTLQSPALHATNKLSTEIETRITAAVVGVVDASMLSHINITYIDPVELRMRLNKFERHVIHLSPTLEQEFFVVAQYLGNTTVANAHAVIRSDGAAAMADVLQRSLVTFGGSL